MTNLQQKYNTKIIPSLQKELNLTSSLAVPRLKKIVVNLSLGKLNSDKNLLETTSKWLADITGQKPKICRAKKAVASFSLRQKDIIGLQVTLRRDRMYNFFHKLVSIVLPQVKDFQGVSLAGFDNNGNYNLGLTEQIIFPEINYDKISQVNGLGINIITTANNNTQAKLLLKALGMPFAKKEKE